MKKFMLLSSENHRNGLIYAIRSKKTGEVFSETNCCEHSYLEAKYDIYWSDIEYGFIVNDRFMNRIEATEALTGTKRRAKRNRLSGD